MTEPRPSFDPDDLARAVLLRVVPRGYRLIDATDTRFPGLRDRCFRLALRHLGPRPCLVAFCDPRQDPGEAARWLAAWAAQNLRPNAIQKRVSPGVLVIAVGAPDLGVAGPVAGVGVPAVVWAVSPEGRAETRGDVPGGPPAGDLRQALRRLLAGEPAPTIGQVDVAERTLMSGRPGRPYFLDSPLLALLGFACGLTAFYGISGLVRDVQFGALERGAFDLARTLLLVGVVMYGFDIAGVRSRVPLLSSSDRRVAAGAAGAYLLLLGAVIGLGAGVPAAQPATSVNHDCPPPHCQTLTAADNGRTLSLPAGDDLEVALDQNARCPATSDTTILAFLDCGVDDTSQPPILLAFFHGARPGTATLQNGTFQVTVEVR
ncbi:MAG TPA: hypothetical protein VG245_05780 [Candidatus Dormibacteraeota bacterium]|nr:hypothetical protein [Candidatus Dormibacteraeota bacterium]